MSTKENILAAYAELGRSAAEVAANLRLLGIKGSKGDTNTCPLFWFLVSKKIISADTKVLTVGSTTTAYDHPVSGDIDIVFNPRPIVDFVPAFDKGHFPFLEK